MFASLPFATMSPLPGTVRSNWWNCQMIASTSAIDIGVVELDVVDDQRARPVVDELGALVEERRVVLVGLDDEILRAAEPRRDAEIGSARRRSGSPGSSPRTRGSTRACSSSSSCRGFRRPRAPTCRAARARRATAAPTNRRCPSSAAPRRPVCRATARCRRRRSRRRHRSAPRSLRRARFPAPRAACSSAGRRSDPRPIRRDRPPSRWPRCRP